MKTNFYKKMVIKLLNDGKPRSIPEIKEALNSRDIMPNYKGRRRFITPTRNQLGNIVGRSSEFVRVGERTAPDGHHKLKIFTLKSFLEEEE